MLFHRWQTTMRFAFSPRCTLKNAVKFAAIFALFFSVSTGIAKADGSGDISYTLTGPASDPIVVTFELPTNPTIGPFDFTPGSGFMLNAIDLTINGVAVTNDPLMFYTVGAYGGLADLDNTFNLENPLSAPDQKLFYGPVWAPTMIHFTGSLDFLGYYSGFDGYTLSEGPVGTPEPTTWMLLGTGLVFLLLFRRTRTAQ